MEQITEEEFRAKREGLDEDMLALFDLLKKPELSKQNITRLKDVAVELLAYLNTDPLSIANWREKEATRDAVKVSIQDFLYSDRTGLPLSYSEAEIQQKVDLVYIHIFQNYHGFQSSRYAEGIA